MWTNIVATCFLEHTCNKQQIVVSTTVSTISTQRITPPHHWTIEPLHSKRVINMMHSISNSGSSKCGLSHIVDISLQNKPLQLRAAVAEMQRCFYSTVKAVCLSGCAVAPSSRLHRQHLTDCCQGKNMGQLIHEQARLACALVHRLHM